MCLVPWKQEGAGNLSLKGTESTVLAVLILLIVLGLVGTAAVAAFNPEQWLTYFHLFDESRLVSRDPGFQCDENSSQDPDKFGCIEHALICCCCCCSCILFLLCWGCTYCSMQVHVSTLDFGLLTAAAPFWMSNDAQRRQWKSR